MNKQILATAIATGLMAPGLAAADIKVFGAIQAETGGLERSGNTNTDVDYVRTDNVLGSIKGGGPNAFGLKGDEKLGNGLTAYFMFNNAFSTFDGDTLASRGGESSGAITARDRYVGFKGDGWHVQFGRMNALYKTASLRYDPFLATGLQSRANGGTSGGHNGFINDVARVGFNSGGLSAGIEVKWEDAFSEDTPQSGGDTRGLNTVDSGSWTGNVKYGEKDWEVGLAYMDFSYHQYTPDRRVTTITNGGTTDVFAPVNRGPTPTVTVPDGGSVTLSPGVTTTLTTTGNITVNTTGSEPQKNDGDLSALKLHGKYNVGDFSLRAQYERIKADAEDITARRGDGASTLVGLEGGNSAERYKSLYVSMTYKVMGSTSLMGHFADTEWEDVNSGQDEYNVDGRHWAIGVKHDFSKRTHVYGGYMDNDYDYSNSRNDEITGWVIGTRHKF